MKNECLFVNKFMKMFNFLTYYLIRLPHDSYVVGFKLCSNLDFTLPSASRRTN